MPEDSHPTSLGRYEIVRELGRGAMGVVYEGRDPKIGRRVAIKTARLDVVSQAGVGDEMTARFLREAQAAGQLNHPNIITIYDADEEKGIAYIAMEFVEGEDLRDLMLRRQSLEISDMVEIAATVCDALAAAHDQGVIHRDIKPANVIMAPGMPLKVADFGIAHVSDSTLTQDGALIGTPHYMSPEQFMGQRLDGRSDLFSVAIMLYEMLTGEKPFTGEQLSTVMHHVVKTDPVPPAELNYNVPESVSRVLLKALDKRPAGRYPDGRAMAAALRESLKDHPDPAVLQLDGAAAAESNEATVVRAAGEKAAASPEKPPAAPHHESGAQTSVAKPSQSATVPGQTPPGVMDTAPTGEAAPLTAETPRQRRQTALYLGAAAVVLVALAAGLALTLRNSTPGEPVSGGRPPAAAEASVVVAVYGSPDVSEVAGELDRSNFQSETAFREAVQRHDLKRVPNAEVVAWDYSDDTRGGVLARTTTDTDGEAILSIPHGTGRVFFEVTYSVDGERRTETLTTANWRTKQVFVVLL